MVVSLSSASSVAIEEQDAKKPSVVSRLDPVLRKALLQALSNLESEPADDEPVSQQDDLPETTTIVDELL